MSRHRAAKEPQLHIRQIPADPDSTDRRPQTEAGHDEIARLAYLHWESRGRPEGSAEEDWFHAVTQLNGK